jgi:hypothetical protein
MMKNAYFLILLAVLILNSCSSDPHKEVKPDEPTPDEPTDNIYFNFILKDSSYNVSRSTTYSFLNSGYVFVCAKEYVYGRIRLSLEDRNYTSHVTAVKFQVTKKVFKDELDPRNELSYLNQVVTADSIGFPINTNGYFEVYDLENSVFRVNRNVSAEAYLEIITEDTFYRSSSVVPNERDPNSFIGIDRVIENTGNDSYEYPYLLEGTFKVNLFEGMYGTTSQIVEGDFRWPVGRVENSQILIICK